MKRTSRAVFIIIALGFILSSQAFGFEPQTGPGLRGMCMNMPPAMNALHTPMVPPGVKLLTDCIQINVISSLTGLTQENVRQLLISSPPQAILDAYSIPNEAFRQEMDKAALKIVSQALASGMISKSQSEDINKKLSSKDLQPCNLKKVKN